MNISIEQLAEAITKKMQLSVPLSVAQWDSAQCAAYLSVTQRHFTAHIKTNPDFPRARNLPSVGATKGHPRWKAEEVIEWFEGK